MKTVLAIRHVHFENLGVFEGVLHQRGWRIRYVTPGLDALPAHSEADLLVVLGGPIGVLDGERYPFLADELRLIEDRLRQDRPLLGICLGAQLIAHALGAAVTPMHAKEIGFGPLTLTDAGRASPLAALGNTPVLHWHGDRFDMPAGARHLAGTNHCIQQAFSYGSATLALQCHLEADPTRIEPWLIGHATELAGAGVDVVALRAQARACANLLPAVASQVFATWLRQCTE